MATTGDNIGVGINVTLTDNASSQLAMIQKAVGTLNTSINKINTTKIDDMTKSFTALSKTMGNSQIKNLENTQKALTSFATIPKSASTIISKLAESVSKLKATPAQAKNITNLAASFKKIGASTESLKTTKNITDLATAINKLNAQHITTVASSLTKLSSSLRVLGTGSKDLKPTVLLDTGKALKDMNTSVSRIKPDNLRSFGDALGVIKKNTTTALATNFKSLGAGFKVLATNTQGLNTKAIDTLGKAILAVKTAVSGKLSSSISTLASSFKKLSDSVTAVLPDKIKNVGAALKKLETPNISKTTTQVKNLDTAITKAGTDANKSSGKTDKAADSYKKLGDEGDKAAKSISELANQSALTSFAGIVDSIVVLGAVFRTFKPAIEFEQSMDKVRAIANASEGDMNQLTAQVLEMGRTTIFSAAEAAGGMTILTQAGFQATDALEALPTVLQLAAAGGIEVNEAASIATATMHGFGMEASDLSGLMDTLAVAAMNSNTNISELGKAMKTAAPIARAAGEDISSLTTVLGAMANAGIKGSNAGQNYKRMVLRLIEPTAKASKALDELGVTTTTASGDLKSLTGIMQELNDAGMSLQQSKEIFGLWSAAAALAVSQNADSLNDLKAIIGSSDGALQAMAKTMTDNVAGSFKRLHDSVVQVALNGLTPFMETLNSIVLTFKSFAEKIATALEHITPLQSKLLGMAGIFTAIVVGINLFNIVLLRAIGGVMRFVQSNAALKKSLYGVDGEVTKNIALLKAKVISAKASVKQTLAQKIASDQLTKSYAARGLALSSLTKEELASTVSKKAATIATNTGTAAIARQAGVTAVASAGIKIFGRSIGFLGKAVSTLLGPWGILLMTAASIIPMFIKSKDSTEGATVSMQDMAKAANESSVRLQALKTKVEELDATSSKGDTKKAFNDLSVELQNLSEKGPEKLKTLAAEAASTINSVDGSFSDGGLAVAAYQKGLNDLQIDAAEESLGKLKKKLYDVEAAAGNAYNTGNIDEYNKKLQESITIERQIEQTTLKIEESKVKAAKANIKNLAKLGQLSLDMSEKEFNDFLALSADKYGLNVEIARKAYDEIAKVAREKAEEQGLDIVQLAQLRKNRLISALDGEKKKYAEITQEISKYKKQLSTAVENKDKEKQANIQQRINELIATQTDIQKKIKGGEKQIQNAVIDTMNARVDQAKAAQKEEELLGNIRGASIKGLDAEYNEALVAIEKWYVEQVKMAVESGKDIYGIMIEKNNMILNAEEKRNKKVKDLDEKYRKDLRTDEENEVAAIDKSNNDRLKAIEDRYKGELKAAEGNALKTAAINERKNADIKASELKHSKEMAAVHAASVEDEISMYNIGLTEKENALKNQLANGEIDQGDHNVRLKALEATAKQDILKLRTEVFNKTKELYDVDSDEYRDAASAKVNAEQAAVDAILAARQALDDQSAAQAEARNTRDSNAINKRIAETNHAISMGVMSEERGQKEIEKLQVAAQQQAVDNAIRRVAVTRDALNFDVKKHKEAVAEEEAAEMKLDEVKAGIEKKQEQRADAAEKKEKARLQSFGNWIASQYNNVANAMAEISVKAIKALGANNIFFDTVAKNAEIAGDEVAALDAKIQDAIKTADSYEQAVMKGGIFTNMYRDLGRAWDKVTVALREQKQYTEDMNKLVNIQIDETTDLNTVMSKLTSVRENYAYLGDEEIKQIKEAKAAIMEKVKAQASANEAAQAAIEKQAYDSKIAHQDELRQIAEEKYAKLEATQESVDSSSIEKVQNLLDAAKQAGLEIENYSFDEAGAARLQSLKDSNSELDAQIAKLKYEQYLEYSRAKKAMASEEDLTALRKKNEQDLQVLYDKREGNNLEYDAIDSELNLRMTALKIENDLKIKNYQEDLDRAQAAHDAAMASIEEEKNARLAIIDEENEKLTKQYDDRIAALEAQLAEQLKILDAYNLSAPGANKKFARGGRLPGEGTQDSVRVLARPGEWFIRNESAKIWNRKFGSSFMQGINNPLSSVGRAIMGQLSDLSGLSSPSLPSPSYGVPTTGIQAFATGGEVQSESGAQTTRIELKGPSGASVITNVEGSVKSFLNILQEAGMRT